MGNSTTRTANRIANGPNDNEARVTNNRLDVNAKITDGTDSADVISTNGTNGLVTISPGHVSTDNSSSNTLSAGGVYPGTWEDITNFGIIVVSVIASHASATDGLMVEFSSDGTNVDGDDTYTIPAATGKTFSFQAATKYFRVKYTNSGDDQTYFRLQTILKPYYVKPSSHRIQDAIIDDDDAELVKSVNTGKDPNGIYRNVNVTVDGDMAISDNSNGLSIARGNVTGLSFIHKFGNAPDFDTGDNEVTVWDGAEDNTAWENMVYDYSSTADIQYISSTDNGDTQTIEIQGLDSNYDLIIQTKDLTGQTSATLDTALIRVFRMKNTNSSDLAGHVFCSTTTAGAGGIPTAANIRAVIQPGNNQTLMAVFTVPNGYTGYMRDWYSSTAGANKNSNYIVKLYARPFGGVFQVKHVTALSDNGTSAYQHKYEEPEVFAAKTDLHMTAQVVAVGATAASVSAGFDIVLVED